MADLNQIVPHFNEERSYAELRSEFRAQNLARIRSLLKDYRVNGVRMKMLGEPLATKEIFDYDKRVFVKGGTAEGRARLLDYHLSEPVSQDFGLADVPEELWQQIEKLAQESIVHDSVTWGPEVTTYEHDGPPAEKPLHEMSEPELIAYVDDAIEESKKRCG